MWHTLLSSKGFLVSLIICLLLIAGSLVYQESVNRDIRERETSTRRFLQQLETNDPARTTSPSENTDIDTVGQTDAPVVTDDTREMMSEETDGLPIDDAEFVDADVGLSLEETPETGDAPVSPYGVSPYGFGPYPEIPAGFPENLRPVWTWSEEKLERIVGKQKNFELMHRVLIKLWNQGDQDFVGVTRGDDNGKVYPIYPGVTYVAWREVKDLHGKVHRYPGFALSGPDVPRLSRVDFAEGRGYPPHVTVLDRETTGIEPYQFLGLQRR